VDGGERKLRVGLLVDRAQPARGGAERALFQLARHLVARGHGVLGFALEIAQSGTDAGTWERLPAPAGLTRGARERRQAEALLARAEDAGCDVTLGLRHLPRVDLLWLHGGAHAVTLAASRSARAGRELGPAEPPRWSRHRTFLELERAALGGGARRVICVSRLVEDELARAYPAARERLVRCDNGVDLERFHPREREARAAELRRRLGLEERAPVISCAARNPSLKGVPTLFEALAQLGARPWQLVLAGPRDAPRWRRLARAQGLDERRVRVVDELDPRLLAAADLAVLPTWRDTCGLALLEALAAGTPVVTTARAGAAELVSGAQFGQVVERPGDADALALALAAQLERSAAGVDRERVRAAVLQRGLASWLAALEAQLVLVAAEKRACPT
jgi:glycosyltransferase involved in cell wall biosynthesis